MNARACTLVVAAGLAVFACDGASSAPGANDAGDASAVDAAPVIECAAPTKGPTKHDSAITKDETWTADASPHVLTWDVYVKDGATLTIEPCAEVLLEKERVLGTRDGKLVAEGTANKPIRIAGKDGAEWTKLEFNSPGLARLAYVTVEGGGGADVNDQDGASVEVRGNGGPLPAPEVLYVDHVTVKGSRGAGVAVFGHATFVSGSHDLVVTGSGGDKFPYPISIEEHSIDALPTGSYTGNKKDEIYLSLVGAGTAGDGLKVDATLHDRGVPYRLDGGFNVAVNEDGGKLATLTIEPGVTMKFPKGKAFKVETWTSDEPATGAVRALGTAERPIVFTSAEDSPAPGDWMGFWFGGVPSAENKFDHVIIEYTGANCSCSLASCSDLKYAEGAVMLTNHPAGGTAFITNTTIRHAAGHGIVEGWRGDGDTSIDFQPTNTFEDVSGCVQTRPLNNQGCPKPKPECW